MVDVKSFLDGIISAVVTKVEKDCKKHVLGGQKYQIALRKSGLFYSSSQKAYRRLRRVIQRQQDRNKTKKQVFLVYF